MRVLRASDVPFVRVDTPAEAVAGAPEGGGVLLLAGGYPDTLTAVDSTLYAEAARKRLRLVVEFPVMLPGGPPDSVFAARWERGVTTGDAFAPDLGRHRIVMVHSARVAAFRADTAWLALARVAGLDAAVYGLAGTPAHPALFEVPGRDLLVATTQLSRFVTARYAPPEAWTVVWTRILAWVAPDAEPPALVWEPTVRPAFGVNDALPPDAAARAVRRGADWFHRARMLVDSAWADRLETAAAYDDRVGPGPELDLPVGDGTLGVLEGFSSNIRWDGSQWVRWWLRADCASETAMALALRTRLEGDARDTAVAANLQDWVYRTLQRDTTGRDPDDPEYGLVAWNTVYDRVYYGDDNAPRDARHAGGGGGARHRPVGPRRGPRRAREPAHDRRARLPGRTAGRAGASGKRLAAFRRAGDRAHRAALRVVALGRVSEAIRPDWFRGLSGYGPRGHRPTIEHEVDERGQEVQNR